MSIDTPPLDSSATKAETSCTSKRFLRKTCLRLVQDLPKACPRCQDYGCQNLADPAKDLVQDLPKILGKSWSKTCPRICPIVLIHINAHSHAYDSTQMPFSNHHDIVAPIAHCNVVCSHFMHFPQRKPTHIQQLFFFQFLFPLVPTLLIEGFPDLQIMCCH